MHYYIDGYNLIFRLLPHVQDLAAKRQQIIEELNSKATALNLQITIVFDSHFQISDDERFHFHSLEIMFTGHGETADDRILFEIAYRANPRQITVVTSDKKLAWYARHTSAKTETVEDFLNWLNTRYLKKASHRLPKDKFEPSKKASQVPPTAKSKIPPPNIPPEQCFDYYLEKFQKNDD